MFRNMAAETLKNYRKLDIFAKHKIPPTLLNEVVESAKDWAISHGLVMKFKENPTLSKHAPFVLFPSPFPTYLYNEAFQVQKDFQTLFHRASLDHEFIKDSLKSVIIHDEFTKLQYDLYEKVRQEGIKPKIYFDIARSDYMIDQVKTEYDSSKPLTEERPYEIKQIEMNMIAASFSGLSSSMPSLHRYIANELEEHSPFNKEKVAMRGPIKGLGEGMAKAFELYGNENAVVLFIIETVDLNRFDQKQLTYAFHEGCQKLGLKKRVKCLFRTFEQVAQNGKLDGDRKLILENKEVAITYFRTGYTPCGLSTKERIGCRLMMERSRSIKCPTIAMQLINTKKVQQVMAKPGIVEKFIHDENAVRRIRKTFAGLYSLDEGSEGDEAAKMALNDPTKYILKPQREGGGNNLYDEEMINELKRVSDKPDERSQYILMERIRPPVVHNYLIHHDMKKETHPVLDETIAELGIFGVHISVENEEVVNESSGHLLRTKSIHHNDGGVVSGLAVLDTPYLYDGESE